MDRTNNLSSGSERSVASPSLQPDVKEGDDTLEEGTPKSNDFVERVKSAVSAAVAAITPHGPTTRQQPKRSASSATAILLEDHKEEVDYDDKVHKADSLSAEDHDYELELEESDVEGKHRAVISPNNLSSREGQPKDQHLRDQAQAPSTSSTLHRPSPAKRISTFKREPEYESSMTLDVPGLHTDEQEGDDEMEMEFESTNSRGPGSISASESEYSVSAGEEEQELEPPQPP